MPSFSARISTPPRISAARASVSAQTLGIVGRKDAPAVPLLQRHSLFPRSGMVPVCADRFLLRLRYTRRVRPASVCYARNCDDFYAPINNVLRHNRLLTHVTANHLRCNVQFGSQHVNTPEDGGCTGYDLRAEGWRGHITIMLRLSRDYYRCRCSPAGLTAPKNPREGAGIRPVRLFTSMVHRTDAMGQAVDDRS